MRPYPHHLQHITWEGSQSSCSQDPWSTTLFLPAVVPGRELSIHPSIQGSWFFFLSTLTCNLGTPTNSGILPTVKDVWCYVRYMYAYGLWHLGLLDPFPWRSSDSLLLLPLPSPSPPPIPNDRRRVVWGITRFHCLAFPFRRLAIGSLT